MPDPVLERELTEEADEKPKALQTTDEFQTEWDEAREYWKQIHRIYDYAYLFYKSIVTLNNIYGERYLKSFGLQVSVPRTFMTVEAISSQMLNRKIEFAVGGRNFRSSQNAHYQEKRLNGEWKRSKADKELRDAERNALIFGNGYLLNTFVDDVRDFHFVKEQTENPEGEEGADVDPAGPEDPEDGAPNAVTSPTKGLTEDDWELRKTTIYKGMKPNSLNPYNVFTDPHATNDENRRYVYLYSTPKVQDLIDFVVGKGWMTEEEAKAKIQSNTVQRFDEIRDTLDVLYNQPLTPYTRGDHQVDTTATTPPTARQQNDMVGIVERFGRDGYEIRIDGSNETLYKDYNVYPHKQIPIITFWDVKVPGEFRGMGEPEIIRYQQVEENKIHNLLLHATLMTIVQRYAIRGDLLEDEADLSFADPFKPLRLKQLPGNDITKAIMPMTQPDVKRSPFELMDLVKEIIQQSTGATDFVISASNAVTDTATESDNLVAASAARIRSKLVTLEEGLVCLAEQWLACFPAFYDEDMDFQITGEKAWYKYLPYDRAKANEDPTIKAETQAKLQYVNNGAGVTGDTVEQMYKYAGYTEVIFQSDLTGGFVAEVRITDLDSNLNETTENYLKVIKVMSEANAAAAATGDKRRFDVFKLSKDLIRNYPMIKNVDEYIQGEAPENMGLPKPPEPEQPAEPMPLPEGEITLPANEMAGQPV